MQDAEEARRLEEKEKTEAQLSATLTYQPSLPYILLLNKVRQTGSNVISAEKLPDFHNSIMPIANLLPDEDAERMMLTMKELYFHLKSMLETRKNKRNDEAAIISRQTKREKSIEKSKTEITKQKKNASKDRTLSPFERGKAQFVENMTRVLGCSEAEAVVMFEASMKSKK
jgi:hypothetical protein